MTIAAIQMASTSDVNANIENALKLIKQAKEKGATVVALPEEFATLGLTSAQKYAMIEPFAKGEIQQRLAKAAKSEKIWIIGGTLPIKNEECNNVKITSSCVVWDEDGEIVSRYDKIHLFDVQIASESYRESDNFSAGKQIQVFPSPLGKIGIAICYDVRFPELFRAMMLKGVDIIVLPSAFTINTGKAHWETLLKARAIENLCYLVAPAEVGLRANGVGTYGHSMIISPWGESLACLDEGMGVITANIDLEKMIQLRKQFPVLSHYQAFVMQALIQGE